MNDSTLIGAIDQGTSSTRFLVVKYHHENQKIFVL